MVRTLCPNGNTNAKIRRTKLCVCICANLVGNQLFTLGSEIKGNFQQKDGFKKVTVGGMDQLFSKKSSEKEKHVL